MCKLWWTSPLRSFSKYPRDSNTPAITVSKQDITDVLLLDTSFFFLNNTVCVWHPYLARIDVRDICNSTLAPSCLSFKNVQVSLPFVRPVSIWSGATIIPSYPSNPYLKEIVGPMSRIFQLMIDASFDKGAFPLFKICSSFRTDGPRRLKSSLPGHYARSEHALRCVCR